MKTINEQTNWWVRVTEENKETLDKWFKSSSYLKGKVGVYLNYQSIYCKGTILESTPAKDKDGSWDFGNEISFEEFKRYILKEYAIPENWCIKITNSNNSYLNEKRVHGCTDYGFLNYYLNDGITDFWNWSADFPKGCIEITLDDFKKHVILEPTAKGYPTSLETVKFKSEPDKCVGKQPHHVYMGDDDYMTITSMKQDLIDKEAKRQAQKVFNFGSRYGMSSQKLNEIIKDNLIDKGFSQPDAIDAVAIALKETRKKLEDQLKEMKSKQEESLKAMKFEYSDREISIHDNPIKSSYKPKGQIFFYGTGREIDNNHYEELFKDPFKWAELPDNMLKQRTMYGSMFVNYPLTPKECFKAPSDIIYVKKLKTFLK